MKFVLLSRLTFQLLSFVVPVQCLLPSTSTQARLRRHTGRSVDSLELESGVPKYIFSPFLLPTVEAEGSLVGSAQTSVAIRRATKT